MSLKDLLDPDRDWRSLDKVEHAALGFAVCCLATFLLPGLQAFLFALWTGAVYEAGQTDTAYSLRDGSGRRYAGQPGFGFSFLDLAFDVAGAGLYLALRGVV
jgi:hypothetical protein